MKYKELASMPKEELQEKLNELRMDLIKNNAQIAVGTVPKSSGQVKQTKKTIAKIKQLIKTKTEDKKA